jgi:hypothetical protein
MIASSAFSSHALTARDRARTFDRAFARSSVRALPAASDELATVFVRTQIVPSHDLGPDIDDHAPAAFGLRALRTAP